MDLQKYIDEWTMIIEAKDAEIARLKEELEYERIRLAACGQAALDNTPH